VLSLVFLVGLLLVMARILSGRFTEPEIVPSVAKLEEGAPSKAGLRSSPTVTLESDPLLAARQVAVEEVAAVIDGDPVSLADPAPVDEPPLEEILDSELPADPMERGSCELFLNLVDDETGAPVEASVQLWRLNAPGNEHWTAGDRRQERANVGFLGRLFVGLPEGSYRAVCSGQRESAPDLPAFEVTCPRTLHAIALAAPRSFRLFVDVFDSTGLPIAGARLGPAIWTVSFGPPAWARTRGLRSGEFTDVSESVAGISSEEARWIRPGPQGFELGPFLEADRLEGGASSVTLDIPGYSSVVCPLSLAEGRDAHLIALSVALAEIGAQLRLEDGRDALEAGVAIEARCVPRAAPDPRGTRDWRDLPIEVRVRHPDHQELNFEHRLSDGPWPRLVLQRADDPGGR
jgi:hypothetical protein